MVTNSLSLISARSPREFLRERKMLLLLYLYIYIIYIYTTYIYKHITRIHTNTHMYRRAVFVSYKVSSVNDRLMSALTCILSCCYHICRINKHLFFFLRDTWRKASYINRIDEYISKGSTRQREGCLNRKRIYC